MVVDDVVIGSPKRLSISLAVSWVARTSMLPSPFIARGMAAVQLQRETDPAQWRGAEPARGEGDRASSERARDGERVIEQWNREEGKKLSVSLRLTFFRSIKINRCPIRAFSRSLGFGMLSPSRALRRSSTLRTLR